MQLCALLRRLDRRLGRFNERFGSTAVASGTKQSQGGPASSVDPMRVSAVLGEIEKGEARADADQDDPRDTSS
jgi:hypothetical protein